MDSAQVVSISVSVVALVVSVVALWISHRIRERAMRTSALATLIVATTARIESAEKAPDTAKAKTLADERLGYVAELKELSGYKITDQEDSLRKKLG